MRTTIAFLSYALTAVAFGQCVITVQLQANYTCQPYQNAPFGGTATVNTSGGTPPFSVVLQKHSFVTNAWSAMDQVFNDADGDHVYNSTMNYWETMDAARVTVTDANNCVATTMVNMTPRVYPNRFLQTFLDCNTGIPSLDLLNNGSWTATPTTYSIDGGAWLPFATDWTPIAGGYRSSSMPAGAHTLSINEFIAQGMNYCQTWHTYTSGLSVTPGDCGVNLRLRAALDGALTSGVIMNDGLRTANLIPLGQPYTALGYTFVGSSTNVSITPSFLTVTGNDAIVDWLVVELRSNATTVAYSKPALLQRDGDLMDTDGDPYLNFPVAAGNYYVVIRHRNHLAVMTGAALGLTVNPVLLDFTTITGNGTNAQVLKNGIYCLWAGDATGNGTLKYTGSTNDRDPLLLAVGSTTPNATVPNVYDRRDTNLDGVIKYTGTANDRDIILTNVGSTTPNNTRTQQLP